MGPGPPLSSSGESNNMQRFCQVNEEGKSLTSAAVRQMDQSARSYNRLLTLAHTIADLAGEENLQTQYLAEALQHRPRELE